MAYALVSKMDNTTPSTLDNLMNYFRHKSRKSSWLISTSPFALAACGGESDLASIVDSTIGVSPNEDDQNDTDGTASEVETTEQEKDEEALEETAEEQAPVSKGLLFKTFDTAIVANLPYGEANAIIDINLDGKPELFVMPSSTRNSNHPVFKDAELFTLDLSDSKMISNSTFVPDLENCSWSDPATFCGVTESNPTTVNFDGAWLKISWTQDVKRADFNGDGIVDLFVSGHGREWPENWEGSDSSADFGLLLQEPGFSNYPGDLIQVVLAGEQPKVLQVSEYQAFWHSARVGDFDGDGDPDVIATTTADPFNTTPSLELYQNDGSANFTKFPLPAQREGDTNPSSIWFGASVVDMADLDNDGIDEIILPGNVERDLIAKKIYIYDYDGSAIVETKSIDFPTVFRTIGDNELDKLSLHIDKLNTGDYDGDGDIDLIAKFMTMDPQINQDIDGYLGHVIFENIDGEFLPFMYETEQTTLQGGDGAWFIDIDYDGDLDVVHTGWPGNEDASLSKWHRDVTTISDLIWINKGNNQFEQLSQIQEVNFELTGMSKSVGENYKIIHWNVAEYEGTNYYFIVGLDEIATSTLEIMTLTGDFLV